MQKMNKVLLSGIKPTGKIHIGNYFGAIQQVLELQDLYKCFVLIADYHALTTIRDRAELNRNTMDLATAFLATGLDPQKTIIFKQSDVPEVTELAWIFSCLMPTPFLQRAHAYKDASAKNKEINVGVFSYPILMAADILIFNSDVVPVGQDQKQHIEITTEIAKRFNNIYGEEFKIPQPYILEEKIILGTDGKKMSKSYNNTINLFSTNDEIKEKIMSVKTDSKGTNEVKNPHECNVFALHRMFSKRSLDDLEKRYLSGTIGYKESKEILIENIIQFIKPLREKKESLEKNQAFVMEVLAHGAEEARKKAQYKMKIIKDKIGVSIIKKD